MIGYCLNCLSPIQALSEGFQSVTVDTPSEIVLHCFPEYCAALGSVHRGVMFKAVGTDVPHQLLQVRNLDYGAAPKCREGIIRETAFAHVRAHAPVHVIGADSGEGHWTGRCPAGNRAVRVLFS